MTTQYSAREGPHLKSFASPSAPRRTLWRRHHAHSRRRGKCHSRWRECGRTCCRLDDDLSPRLDVGETLPLGEPGDDQPRTHPSELAKPRPRLRRDEGGEAAQEAVEDVRIGRDELELTWSRSRLGLTLTLTPTLTFTLTLTLTLILTLTLTLTLTLNLTL